MRGHAASFGQRKTRAGEQIDGHSILKTALGWTPPAQRKKGQNKFGRWSNSRNVPNMEQRATKAVTGGRSLRLQIQVG